MIRVRWGWRTDASLSFFTVLQVLQPHVHHPRQKDNKSQVSRVRRGVLCCLGAKAGEEAERRMIGLKSMIQKSFKEKVRYSNELIEKFLKDHKKTIVSCSFGKDSTVMLHLVLRFAPDIPVVFANTGVEAKETLEFRDFLVKHWNLNYVELTPEKSFWECVKEYGYPKPRRIGKTPTPKCCYWLKEKPFMDFYKKNNIDGVFLGFTFDENQYRGRIISSFGDCYYHKKKSVWTCHPIAYWSTEEVWNYTRKNNLPVNKAYEKVPRTGCVTCTGYIGWEKNMACLHPKLYEKIALDMGNPTLSHFDLTL